MSFSAPDPTRTDAQKRTAARKARAGRDLSVCEPVTAGQQALAGGSIRKALGIEAEDLRFGLKLAADRMWRGGVEEALQLYAALVLCEPMNVDFQTGLANCALQMSEPCLALQAASVIIALEPTNYRGYYISGRACLLLGERADAKEDLSQALALAEQAKDAVFVSEVGALLKKLTALESR